MRPSDRLSCAVVGAAILMVAAAAAPQPPTFRVDVNLVQIDAIVTDASGRFVGDLTKNDFQVLEDGVAQTVSTFALVDLSSSSRPAGNAPRAMPTDVVSNARAADGRLYVLLLDDLHISPQRARRVKQAALQFVETRLAASDLAAVVYTSQSDRGQELTNRIDLVKASVERLSGDSLPPAALLMEDDERPGPAGARLPVDKLAEERRAHAVTTLSTLRKVSELLASVRGRRKAILLMGEGIDVDITDPKNLDLIGATREVIAAAARANASIYGIHSLGLAGLADEGIENGIRPSAMNQIAELTRDSLQVLSNNTGGFAAVNQNDFVDAYDRIVRETSAYYLVGYYPAAKSKDGATHKIEVRVTRPGVTVRARKSYTSIGSSTPARRTQSKSGAASPTDEALGALLPVGDLPMTLFATPFRKSGRDATILLGVEIGGGDLRPATGGALEMTFVAVDAQGKTRANDTSLVKLTELQSGTRERIEQAGLRALYRLELRPGRHQIRAAARETASGKVGSVFYDLDVPDFQHDAIAVSGIAIASKEGAAVPTPIFDEALKTTLRAVLPAPPGALRTFSRDETLVIFAEAYVNRPARTLKVTTSLTADGGQSIFAIDQDRNVENGRCGLSASVPTKDLAPGSYTLTVTVASDETGSGSVSRSVRFAIRGR